MANQAGDDTEWDDEETANYKAPEKKTLDELKKLNAGDESLQRYKEALLGAAASAIEPPFPNDPNNVVIDKFCICVDGQPDIEVNLRGDVAKMKSSPIPIPEGATYRIKVYYYVQREIVSGLRYKQNTSRGSIKVDQASVMLGSYGPQKEAHVWVSESEEAPKGIMSRGTYHCKSRFTDDDKNDYATWDWYISVVKSSASSNP